MNFTPATMAADLDRPLSGSNAAISTEGAAA
jgi:hypothetical protein